MPVNSFSMCQEMSTDFYTRWELDRSSQNVEARTHKLRAVGNMVITHLQPQCPECTFESYYSTGKQKKIDCFCVDVFCAHCNTVFEAMGCCFHFLRIERSPSKPLVGGNAERNQKREENKGFLPYEWFNSPNKLDATFLPPMNVSSVN